MQTRPATPRTHRMPAAPSTLSRAHTVTPQVIKTRDGSALCTTMLMSHRSPQSLRLPVVCTRRSLGDSFHGQFQTPRRSSSSDSSFACSQALNPNIASPITSTESENYISDAERDEAYRVWPTKDCPPNPRPDIWAAPTCYGSRRDDEPGSPVQVRVYMIDRFGLSVVGSRVLKKEFNAIWHVGVTVHGREYNFSDKVAYMELTKTDMDLETAHGFAPSYIYEIGNTTKTKEELDQFVFGKLAKEYSIKQYCSFNHNCHHFSDELVQFLTAKKPVQGGFPQWCLDHGQCALSNLTQADAKTITNASNKIAKVMLVSFGKFNRERVKILSGENREWIVLEDEDLK